MAMLEVKDLNVYYGAIHAIKNISFEVNHYADRSERRGENHDIACGFRITKAQKRLYPLLWKGNYAYRCV